MATTPNKIARQNSEFDCVRELVEQYRRLTLTGVVDDDYPSVRQDYEMAVHNLIQAFTENGRL